MDHLKQKANIKLSRDWEISMMEMLVMLLLAYAKQVMSIMCCITGSWMDMKDNAER
jgi:hypothetical protein